MRLNQHYVVLWMSIIVVVNITVLIPSHMDFLGLNLHARSNSSKYSSAIPACGANTYMAIQK